MAFKSINPASGEDFQSHPLHGESRLNEMLSQAVECQRGWKSRSLQDRLVVVGRLGELLREHAQELAELMAREMGKPVSQGRAEAEKCAWVCEYYVTHADSQLADIPVETEALKSYISFQPIGVLLAIMPWNFPLWQVIRVAVPALLVGNGALIKHAPTTLGSSALLVQLFEKAGMPQGLLASIHAETSSVPTLLADPRIAAVTLTGSAVAGRSVAELAGRNLKKCVLELGGSDANVVLADADLELAARTCVTSRMINNGQSCIAAKRLIVEESVHKEFLEHVLREMDCYKMNNPLDEGCQLGPMARRDLRDQLHDQVQRSVSQGACLVMGGVIPDDRGWWYPATVLDYVGPGMAAFDEELFGPVAVVIPSRDAEHALELANMSEYGLGAAIFSRDTGRAEQIARERLEAGSCFANSLVRSDPRMPFGGIKNSGYGRELSGFGLHEFVNIKTVVVEA